MAKTNKLVDLITYKVLSDKRVELEKRLAKEEKNLRVVNRAIENSKQIARLLFLDRVEFENAMAKYANAIDRLRIKTNLEIVKIDETLLKIELKTYTED